LTGGSGSDFAGVSAGDVSAGGAAERTGATLAGADGVADGAKLPEKSASPRFSELLHAGRLAIETSAIDQKTFLHRRVLMPP
jgi:hypothetical protein